MSIRSVSFDDDSDDGLCVFSGTDLLVSYYDIADLDWSEVSERTLIDGRRGLVLTQVAVIEDLIDEFVLYLEDPPDTSGYRDKQLNGKTIGPRLDMLEELLKRAGLLDGEAEDCLSAARSVVRRRNRLAHGTLECRPTRIVPIAELVNTDREVEWLLIDRRSSDTERISMAGLRQDLSDAIGAFTGLLAYAERFVERAPTPTHFVGGVYVSSPSH